MSKQARNKVIAVLAGVGLAAVLLPGAVASGTGNPAPVTGGGVLRLHLGWDSDYFRFDPPTGSGQQAVKQKLTSSKCAATLSPASSLVTLGVAPAPPAAKVGLFDHHLGVKSSNEILGTGCSTINQPAESLTVALSGILESKAIDFGELDLGGFAGTTIRAEAKLDGTSVGGATVTLGGFGLTKQRWKFDPAQPFDQLTLSLDASTPNGVFWLDGGGWGTPALPGGLGDGLRTNDTVFQLLDFTGVIDCGDDEAPIGGGGTPTAQLSRGPNPNCSPLPYVLRVDDDSVLLQKDASSQPGANFVLTIGWEPEPAPTTALPLTIIDYDGDGPRPPAPVLYCDGTPLTPSIPNGENWCLVRQTVIPAGTQQVQITEEYYGAGDPRWAR